MLVKLVIKNLALIDYLDLDIESGFIVLSGETGAGKSLILDALSLILGYRASAELIRTGADKTSVQAVFEVDELPAPFADLLEENQLIVAREISQNGRSVARINGQLVTVSLLRDLGKHLVDLHGQHEHQSLLQVSKHREVLDRFAGTDALALLDKIKNIVYDYRQVEIELQELLGDERERERRLEMLRYQQEEIAAADLQADEEEELLAVRQRLTNYERLEQAVNHVYGLLSQSERGLPSVADQLAEVVSSLVQVEHFDEQLADWVQVLQEALYNIEDVARSLRGYRDNLVFDAGALETVEQRLDHLNRLKRKYADSLVGIIAYGQTVSQEIERIENSGESIAALKYKKKNYETEYQALASSLSQQRNRAAQTLEDQMQSQFAALGLEHALLTAAIRSSTNSRPQSFGRDEIEFMFNANPGETPKPLTKVISGGEMSRVMLALKTLLAEHDPVGTLIFDEIDAGLGGRIATAVGEKLRELAAKRQVICVSHLASIAALADQHLLITKDVKGDATFTRVKVLESRERVAEIARMLDGQMSATALAHARQLLQVPQNG